MTTDAPSRASAQPIAKPIPAVDPVTKAFFPSSCKFIASFFSRCVEKLSNPKAFEVEISFREEHRSGDLCGALAFKPVFHVAGHVLFNRNVLQKVRRTSNRVHDLFKRPDQGLDDSLFRFGACGVLFR